VIHRQAIVHAVLGLHVDETGEPVAPLHEPVVADVRRLGKPGGPRGVDAERTIFERGRGREFAHVQRLAGQFCKLLIEVWHARVRCAAQPAFHSGVKQRANCTDRLAE
jgi:hypothetical protein